MKQRRRWVGAIFFTALAVAAGSPLAATDFSLYGSYWDTDIAGEAGGGGISFGLPFNDTFAIELRGTYYEELSDDPLGNIFDSDDPVFEDRSIQVLPLEAGVRFTFGHGGHFRPHLGGGVSYFLLDSDFGEISDEVGWYAAAGATVGDGQGAEFFFEGIWREATATVEIDPEDFGDIDDIDVDHHESFDMGGIGVNVGVRWTF